jgi:hypothetical protein
MSAADWDFRARATPCPAHIDSASISPVVPAIGGAGSYRTIASPEAKCAITSPAPHRALRNSTADAWEAAGRPPLAQRPGAGEVIAHFASGEAIVRYEPAPPMAGTTGQIEALSMWAGQSVALARKTQSAAHMVTELTSRL